jgi:hypothetical protein
MPGPSLIAGLVAFGVLSDGSGVRLARFVAIGRSKRHRRPGRRRRVTIGPARAVRRVDEHAGGLLLLAGPRLRAGLEDVFSLAGGTSCLSNCGTNQGDNYVICNASFAWTIVIHVVANTQRALLH